MVRVGDFGLARDVYSHLYYRADKHSKIPVKWSAPEVLNDGLCTEKSDVVGLHVQCVPVFSITLASSPCSYSGPMEWCAGKCSVWGASLILESLTMTFLNIL